MRARLLSKAVFGVYTSIDDQVWMQLRNVHGVLFGFCYIPPSDSQYYSLSTFSYIEEKLSEFMLINGYVILGDANARFGKTVKPLLVPLNVSDREGGVRGKRGRKETEKENTRERKGQEREGTGRTGRQVIQRRGR